VTPESVRDAAAGRAAAMAISDKWVADGRDPKDPALETERHLLVRSYADLRRAVDRADP